MYSVAKKATIRKVINQTEPRLEITLNKLNHILISKNR